MATDALAAAALDQISDSVDNLSLKGLRIPGETLESLAVCAVSSSELLEELPTPKALVDRITALADKLLLEHGLDFGLDFLLEYYKRSRVPVLGKVRDLRILAEKEAAAAKAWARCAAAELQASREAHARLDADARRLAAEVAADASEQQRAQAEAARGAAEAALARVEASHAAAAEADVGAASAAANCVSKEAWTPADVERLRTLFDANQQLGVAQLAKKLVQEKLFPNRTQIAIEQKIYRLREEGTGPLALTMAHADNVSFEALAQSLGSTSATALRKAHAAMAKLSVPTNPTPLVFSIGVPIRLPESIFGPLARAKPHVSDWYVQDRQAFEAARDAQAAAATMFATEPPWAIGTKGEYIWMAFARLLNPTKKFYFNYDQYTVGGCDIICSEFGVWININGEEDELINELMEIKSGRLAEVKGQKMRLLLKSIRAKQSTKLGLCLFHPAGFDLLVAPTALAAQTTFTCKGDSGRRGCETRCIDRIASGSDGWEAAASRIINNLQVKNTDRGRTDGCAVRVAFYRFPGMEDVLPLGPSAAVVESAVSDAEE